MNGRICKTGARISRRNETLYEEWKCPCCLYRWYESVSEPEPEECPCCGTRLEPAEE